jgi:DNA-nicking Smr family endonuclease
MRKRPLTLEEKALWKAVNVTSKKIHPHHTKEEATLDTPLTQSISPVILPSVLPVVTPRKRAAVKDLRLDDTTTMDKRNATRLRRGEFNIDGTLDLHGQTSIIAHGSLLRFIEQGYTSQKRCLLVITGKGRRSAEEGGILKKQLPVWLASSTLQNKILAVTPAHAKDGGSGAFYVLLRRQRDT